MKKLAALCIIILSGIFIAPVQAQDMPEEYVVQKGDTLWDISGAKFQDSFLWPNLWRVNPQIKNPDLIYPGDVLRIPSLEELTRLPGEVEEKQVAAPLAEQPAVVEKPKQYIISGDKFISSGWISPDYPGIGEIMNAPGYHTAFGKPDLVYLKSDQKISFGDKFYAIRKVKKVTHPKTGKYLGLQIRVTGIVEVVGMDGRNYEVPKAKVTSSFENLDIGDGIIPYFEMDPPVVPEVPRMPFITGYIAESYSNTGIISKGDVVYIDKGDADGIEIGDTFSALVEDPVQRSIGKIQVFSVKPTTSVALVLNSEQELAVGDMWGNR